QVTGDQRIRIERNDRLDLTSEPVEVAGEHGCKRHDEMAAGMARRERYHPLTQTPGLFERSVWIVAPTVQIVEVEGDREFTERIHVEGVALDGAPEQVNRASMDLGVLGRAVEHGAAAHQKIERLDI